MIRSLSMLVAALAFMLSISACAQAQKKAPAGVVYETDVEYGKVGDVSLKMDIARPEKATKATPCIVVIHGGAWRAGSRNMHTDYIFQLAQHGYAAATISYRFCPQHKFPAQIEDSKCAVRYLRAHAKEYNINPEKFGAAGVSAGAHLSLLLGTMGKDDGLEGKGGWEDQSSQVQAVVAFFGPTDLAADDLPEVSKGLVKDFLGGTPKEAAETYKLASPVTYASTGDAPVLIYQGTKDQLVPHTQATKFADALTSAGVPGRVELLLGATHGWGGVDLIRCVNDSFAFFDQHLKK